MSDEKPETPKKPAARKPAAKKPAAKKPEAAHPKTKPIPAVVAKPDASKPEPAETQPTEVIAPAAAEPATASATAPESAPATEPVAAAEPVVVVVEPPKRKRRIWPFVLIGGALLLVILLIVGYVVGENYARTQAIETIKSRVVAVLNVKDPSTVKVDIGKGPVLFQALAGKLNQIDVTASDVTFGELSGAATLHAEDIPTDANAKTKVLDITFSLPEDQVASQLTQSLGDITADSVTLDEPEIVVNTTIDLFFFKLPVGIGLQPSADQGQLVFTPTTVTLGDKSYTPEELRKELGDLAEPFLAKQQLCVSDQIPAALSVTDVDVQGKELVLKIDAKNVALGGKEMSTNGTCNG